ncbi:hypothetical protein [Pseudomonas jilinensis]|nr:hypothetical protein [Pseudomonas jilinensis]
MAKVAGLWADATQINPGDGGQIVMMASGLVKSANMRAEDAWLTALTNWAYNNPDPESRFILASGLVRFLGIYGFSAGLSPECRNACCVVAENILSAHAIFDPAIRKSTQQQVGLENEGEIKKLLEPSAFPRSTHVRGRVSNSIQSPNKPNKSELYKFALEFLSLKLCEEGYAIILMAEDRGNIPSLIIEKNGEEFHVLLHLDVWPESTTPPSFLINTFLDVAGDSGVELKIAKICAFNKYAESEHDKGDITSSNFEFSFGAFESWRQ